MKADWTNADPVIAAELNAPGHDAVPLLLIYPASGGPPNVLGDLVTADSLAVQLHER